MTKEQQEYCLERLCEIRRDKTAELEDEKRKGPQLLSKHEKADLVCAGKYKLDPAKVRNVTTHTDFTDCCDWTKQEAHAIKFQANLEARRLVMESKFKSIRDEFVLGDTNEALLALRSFERTTF